jgi:hypothetical protein
MKKTGISSKPKHPNDLFLTFNTTVQTFPAADFSPVDADF